MARSAGLDIPAYRALVYRHSAARFAFFYHEDQRDHQQDGDAQKAKIVDVGQHGGLALQRALDQGIGLLGGNGRTGAMRRAQPA